MRTISDSHIDDLIEQAHQSPRLRTIYRLHEHEEPVQRMVNALVPGTYITPHKHENPPKVELMAVLRGRVAMLCFEPDGAVSEVHVLDPAGPLRAVDIAPGEIHSMVALEPSAVLEIVQGPFEAATHKQFTDFAPREDDPAAAAYLQGLLARIEPYLAG